MSSYLIRRGTWTVMLVWLLVVFLSSCKKPAAQLPANKSVKVDSIDIELQAYNRMLAEQEDRLLNEYVSKLKADYRKSAMGFWYRVQQTDEKKMGILANDSVVVVAYKMLDLSGNVLDTATERKIRLGKKEIPIGFEEAIKIVQNGQSAQFIVPSYLMYGVHGTDNVPPQTPLQLFITLL